MAIRIPLTNVGTFTTANEVGAGSVTGGISYPFQLPLDTDNVVVKFTSSVAGAGYSAALQTSDDGGTTYYDVARTSIVSNANNTTAEWLAATVVGASGTPTYNVSNGANGSVVGRTIGSAAASSLGSNSQSGLPILGIQNRMFLTITGNVTSAAANASTIKVYVNNQSASHN